jgi:hypothetical protein
VHRIEVEEEQAVIREVRKLAGQGLALRAGCERLASMGLAPRSGAWYPQKVARILRRGNSLGLPMDVNRANSRLGGIGLPGNGMTGPSPRGSMHRRGLFTTYPSPAVRALPPADPALSLVRPRPALLHANVLGGRLPSLGPGGRRPLPAYEPRCLPPCHPEPGLACPPPRARDASPVASRRRSRYPPVGSHGLSGVGGHGVSREARMTPGIGGQIEPGAEQR